jgi:hypothetical protein
MQISKAFLDHFLCPEEFANFQLLGQPVGEPGYFRFGPDAICYGRVNVGFTSDDVRAELNDTLEQVMIERGKCLLPFDPSSVGDNLRHELYVPKNSPGSTDFVRKNLARRAYYAVRPFLPVAVRKHLQRLSLRGWNHKSFPSWPVDRSVDKIFESLMLLALKSQGTAQIPFIWFWPKGKSGCAIMTHDVETRAGLDFCSTLMDLDDSYGIKSSFQIIPEGRYHTPNRILNEMRERGFEVNVHDWNHDGLLYSDRRLFLERAAKINQAVERFNAQGFRAGVLYRNTEWYDAFKFTYDMSIPNVGHLDPQPGGCCTIMPYYIGEILEIPLTTIQDYSLFNILQDYSIEIWKRQIELILEGYGLLSFNTHPDYLIDARARQTYSCLLSHLEKIVAERNVWLTQPREVNSWWRDRSRMRLVPDGVQWKIEGPGKERARIAYAGYDGQRIRYALE